MNRAKSRHRTRRRRTLARQRAKRKWERREFRRVCAIEDELIKPPESEVASPTFRQEIMGEFLPPPRLDFQQICKELERSGPGDRFSVTEETYRQLAKQLQDEQDKLVGSMSVTTGGVRSRNTSDSLHSGPGSGVTVPHRSDRINCSMGSKVTAEDPESSS